MGKYWHSVTLEPDYCNGCTHCLDGCPTEAIRVINGKAKIIDERCIDCGECLKVCPFHAKGALSDKLEKINDYEYQVTIYFSEPLKVVEFESVGDLHRQEENYTFEIGATFNITGYDAYDNSSLTD